MRVIHVPPWHAACGKCETVQPISAFDLETDGPQTARWCLACRAAAEQRPAGEHRLWRRFRQYARDAARAQRSFEISYEEFEAMVSMSCWWCGEHTSERGMDRLDGRLGYEDGNVVACCAACNRMRGTLSPEMFVERCRRIAMKDAVGSQMAMLVRKHDDAISARMYRFAMRTDGAIGVDHDPA